MNTVEPEEVVVVELDEEIHWPCQSKWCEVALHKDTHNADYAVMSTVCPRDLNICTERYELIVQEGGWFCLACEMNHAIHQLIVIPLNFL